MMFCRLPDRANKIQRTKLSSYLNIAAFHIALVLLIFSLGCGNSSKSNDVNSTPGLKVSASLPPASVGTSYNALVAATGGTAPYNFAVVSGELPSGVLLNNSTGKITGTPGASGSFNFSVSVSDFKGASKQTSLQISVADRSSSGSGGDSGSSGSSSGSGTSSGSGSSGGSNSGSSNGGSSSSGSSSPGKSFSNVQRAGGWGQFGQGPPNFVDCSPSPCNGISFWMNQGISSPSTSGSATEFNVGGTTPYSDALWNNHLIGPLSSQGNSDSDRTLVPSLYNFTYDVYFYGSNFGVAEALEFDVNQFFDGMGFIYGHECRILNGNEWAVFDNTNANWVSTGVPCYPNENAWNHLTIKVQRTSDNHLTYKSITLNGETHELNWSFEHGSAPGDWYGITINYQMDGDYKQDSYSVDLDNLTVTYY
jgi:putative Ig domain-containing protein